jgi:hypothetical protein
LPTAPASWKPLGVTITRRWHNRPSEPYPRMNYERHPAMTNIAEQDLLDIDRAL